MSTHSKKGKKKEEKTPGIAIIPQNDTLDFECKNTYILSMLP